MSKVNYRKIFAIQKQNEETIKTLCPEAKHTSGIYVLYRIDENGFRFAYVGLATKSLLTRLAQHLDGYKQHIDLSIRKHGLYDEKKNPYGYKIDILCFCIESECNEKEQYYIKQWADAGWQMRNVTGGSQGQGKFNINENKPSRGYHDGLKQGYENARREVAHWFELHLDYAIRGNPTLNKQKAYDRFTKFIKGDEEDV